MLDARYWMLDELTRIQHQTSSIGVNEHYDHQHD